MDRPTNYLADEEIQALRSVSVASLTTALFARGIKTAHFQGVHPLRPDLRLVGYAYTLRYIPMREDLGGSTHFDNTTNPQRVSVESVEPGDVLVIDARGETGAAVLGDILITRMQQRGVAGVVTDGAFRDSPAIKQIDLPTYARGAAPYMSSILHHPVETNVPIGCGRVAVMPGDVIVGDGEGVVVLPRAMAGEIAREAFEKERYEDWALARIQAGASIHGVYPPSPETLAEYERENEGLGIRLGSGCIACGCATSERSGLMEVRVDSAGEEIAALLAHAGGLGSRRVLEVGCGDGRLTWQYAGLAGRVTAIDPDEERIAQARRKISHELRSRVTFLHSGLEGFVTKQRFDLAILAWSL